MISTVGDRWGTEAPFFIWEQEGHHFQGIRWPMEGR